VLLRSGTNCFHVPPACLVRRRSLEPCLVSEGITKRVYSAIAQTNPVVNGNSAIIATEKGLVFVDSQSYPTAAHSL
jgi:hypothetical protein